jgi:hypothetical protein
MNQPKTHKRHSALDAEFRLSCFTSGFPDPPIGVEGRESGNDRIYDLF